MGSLVNEVARQSTVFHGLVCGMNIDTRSYSHLPMDISTHVRIDGSRWLMVTWETPWPDFLCAMATPVDLALADTTTSNQAERAADHKIRHCLRQGDLILSAYSHSQLWC